MSTWEVAHTVYDKGGDAVREWTEARLDELREGDLKHVLQTLRNQLNSDLEEDPAQQAITYFKNNRHRLRYPEFRSQGYQVGSGTIESGCKRVIGARLKQAGMTWTLEGAWQMIKARSMYLSDEWDAFCDQRQPPRRTYSRCVA